MGITVLQAICLRHAPIHQRQSSGLRPFLVKSLCLIGCYANTALFNPSKDKYYAILLMRMDAREYTLVNYGCSILKTVIGFLPFALLFADNFTFEHGVEEWFCWLQFHELHSMLS